MLRPALLALGIVAVICGGAIAQSFAPTRDVVPNSKTAIAAGAAFLQAYFNGRAFPDGPGYSAQLKGEVWIVREELPRDLQGGGPVLEMSKRNGRVLRIYAEQ